MTRENIMEAMNGIGDHLIAEAAQKLGFLSDTPVTHKPKRRSAFSRFMNSGWGVAAVCALIAVSVMGGIIWAGQQPGVNPPVVTPEETTAPSEIDETVGDTETETEIETKFKVEVQDFSGDTLLPLFDAEQGNLSVSEDGAMVLDAQWGEADPNRCSLIFDPREVVHSLTGEVTAPEAILIKAKRKNNVISAPAVHVGTDAIGRLDDFSVPVHHYRNASAPYEYFIIRTDCVSSFMSGYTPMIYMEWLGLEDIGFSSDDRQMTVYEISFYDDLWEAVFDVQEGLQEDGVVQPAIEFKKFIGYILFAYNSNYPLSFLYLSAKGPEDMTMTKVDSSYFSGMQCLDVLVLEEGYERLADRAFANNEHLRAVYLPDSLTAIEGTPFVFCPNLTHIRLGSGLKRIESGALPISTLTDIDYNGTMKQWCKIKRDELFSSAAIVHCLDGDIDFNATEPDVKQTAVNDTALVWNTPLRLVEGQTVLQIEFTRLPLVNKAGVEKDVILRWALTQQEAYPNEEYGCRDIFYFDIISPADGTILYAISYEDSLEYCRYDGSSIALSKGTKESSQPTTATLFFANYGFDDTGDSFRVRTTHFRLELAEDGSFTVNRNADDKLNTDITVPYPVNGKGDLDKTRQVFRDMETYIVKNYGISNLRPSYLLLVKRPHGDSAIRNLRFPSPLDGLFFGKIRNISPDYFNQKALEDIYESYGAYKKNN